MRNLLEPNMSPRRGDPFTSQESGTSYPTTSPGSRPLMFVQTRQKRMYNMIHPLLLTVRPPGPKISIISISWSRRCRNRGGYCGLSSFLLFAVVVLVVSVVVVVPQSRVSRSQRVATMLLVRFTAAGAWKVLCVVLRFPSNLCSFSVVLSIYVTIFGYFAC